MIDDGVIDDIGLLHTGTRCATVHSESNRVLRMTTISRNRPDVVLLSLYSINRMWNVQHGRPIRCDLTRPFDKRTFRVLDTASSKISVTRLGNDGGLSFGEVAHVTTGGKLCLCYRLGSGSFATCWIDSSKKNAACAVEHLQSSSRTDGSCRNSLGREFESFQCLYTESNEWPKRVVDLFSLCFASSFSEPAVVALIMKMGSRNRHCQL